jgi:hypothetical protein
MGSLRAKLPSTENKTEHVGDRGAQWGSSDEHVLALRAAGRHVLVLLGEGPSATFARTGTLATAPGARPSPSARTGAVRKRDRCPPPRSRGAARTD